MTLYSNVSNETNYTQQYINLNNTAHLASFICYQVIGCPLSALGLVGNLLSILVWTRKRMQWGTASTPCYLVALAISDTLYLILINFILLLSNWKGYDSENGYFYRIFSEPIYPEYITKITEPTINVLANISIYFIVAFTVERFIAIYYPIRGRTWCTPRRASYVILTITLIVAILHIPDYIEHNALQDTLQAMKTPGFQLGFNWGIMALVFAVIPLLILITANLALIRMVLLSKRTREVMTHQRRQDNSYTALTVTIILIVVVFSVCHTPAATILIIYTYRESSSDYHITDIEAMRWSIAFPFANFLAIFNSSINFMLYSAFSKRFRRTLFTTICSMKYNKQLQLTTKYSKTNLQENTSSGRTRTTRLGGGSSRVSRCNESAKRLLHDEMKSMETSENSNATNHQYISNGYKTNGQPTNV